MALMQEFQTKPTPAWAAQVTLANAKQIAEAIEAVSLSIDYRRNDQGNLVLTFTFQTTQFPDFIVQENDWVVNSQAKGVYGMTSAGFHDEYEPPASDAIVESVSFPEMLPALIAEANAEGKTQAVEFFTEVQGRVESGELVL